MAEIADDEGEISAGPPQRSFISDILAEFCASMASVIVDLRIQDDGVGT